MHSIKLYISYLCCFFSILVSAQIPSYYTNIDFTQTGNALKTQLNSLLTTTHTNPLPYTSSSTDTWDALKTSDLDPTNNQNILLIYGYDDSDNVFQTDRTRDKNLNCTSNDCIGLWNREHVFARSLANPSLDTSYPSAGTDVHNLRSSDSQMNSSRNNRIFASSNGNAVITPQGNFYPGDEWKGDVARVVMYMYVRYINQCLANDIAFSANNTHPDMPDIFLQWNAEDPVSNFEIQRNNAIASFQGNRNPFIDNPYIATLIWGGASAEDTWSVLSLQTVSNESTVSIYPTVSKDYLNVGCNSSQNFKYTIIDYSGRRLIHNTLNNNKIEISNLSLGFYILHLKSNQTSTIFRFFKN
jgi:endonuclease I